MTVAIRARSDDDLDACIALAHAVHARDGYPPYLPDGDFTRFLVSADALAVWVATVGPVVAGHVRAAHPLERGGDGVHDPRARCDPDALTVVARLLVAPAHRRQGIATHLLDVAIAYARAHDRTPILDVWTGLPAAIATYERLGWQPLGRITFAPGVGDPLEEVVLVAPAPTPSG